MGLEVHYEVELLLHLELLLLLLDPSFFLVLQHVIGDGGVLPRFPIVDLGPTRNISNKIHPKMQPKSTHAWRVVALKKNSYLLASELFVKNTFASSCCRIVVGLSSFKDTTILTTVLPYMQEKIVNKIIEYKK